MSYTFDDLKKRVISYLGTEIGLPAQIAALLKVERRTVARWAKGTTEIPEWTIKELDALIEREEINIVIRGRDEWIWGKSLDKDQITVREYVVHTSEPRFFARIIAIDEDGEFLEEDNYITFEGAFHYRIADDKMVCDFNWIDEPRDSEHVRQIYEAIAGEYNRVHEDEDDIYED